MERTLTLDLEDTAVLRCGVCSTGYAYQADQHQRVPHLLAKSVLLLHMFGDHTKELQDLCSTNEERIDLLESIQEASGIVTGNHHMLVRADPDEQSDTLWVIITGKRLYDLLNATTNLISIDGQTRRQ